MGNDRACVTFAYGYALGMQGAGDIYVHRCIQDLLWNLNSFEGGTASMDNIVQRVLLSLFPLGREHPLVEEVERRLILYLMAREVR